MKTALKKSFVLIGIALFFVLTAWAEQKIWAWDKNVPEKEYLSPDILKKPVKMQRQYMVIAFVSKVFGGLSVNS